MKHGWEIKQIQDVADIVNGGTPKSKVLEYWDGNVLWITPKDMGQVKNIYVSDTSRRITKQGLQKSSARLVPENSVILSTRAPIGHLVINERPMAFNQGCRGLVPRKNLETKYLYYYLAANVDLLNDLGTGATFKELSKKKLSEVSMPLPQIEEQKRIVAILDGAFEGIEKAQVNAIKCLQSAKELYVSALRICFDQTQSEPSWMVHAHKKSYSNRKALSAGKVSSATRGRAETDRVIEGDLSLSVGKPKITPRAGWVWSKLTDLARLESGHTPSRRHPEYWDGDVAWIGIKDAKIHHGQTIYDTIQHTNQLGLDNSAARLLPKGAVCLSRTASVGYVVVMGAEMATSQDFVNWVCSSDLDPQYLKYLFLAEGDGFLKYSSGAVHQTIYFPEAKAFHICHPPVAVQREIVKFLDKIRDLSKKLEAVYEEKIKDLAELRQSLLEKAFSGELIANNIIEFSRPDSSAQVMATTSPEFAAHVLAFGHYWHEAQRRNNTYGRVKGQKFLHLAESEGKADMGRQPIKDAAGPNDFQHMLRAEEWAKAQQFFEFVPRRTGNGYDFKKLTNYNAMIGNSLSAIKPYKNRLEKILNLMMPMNSQQAEVLATVHAAWNNLLLDKATITDDAIVREARDNWHPSKMNIAETHFRKAIATIRNKGIVPDGTAKRVTGQESFL